MKVIDRQSEKKKEEYMIGGKAKRLFELYGAGFPIKNFVVIDTSIVASIIENNFVEDETIHEIFSLIDFGSCGVAVRSSAVGEDGYLSWAGQFNTCLFVGKNELVNTILKCANARNSKTVRMYAKKHNVEVPPLAIIIQEMVDAESAGVMFTTNPVNKSDEIIIEAVAGVGESLVGGLREPIRFHLDPETGYITAIDGNKEETSLLENLLWELAAYGVKAKNLFGCHQDIEWAVEKVTGKIFINQSRNITTKPDFNIKEIKDSVIRNTGDEIKTELKRLKTLGVSTDYDILSDQNIAEILTIHPSPMAFGLFTYLFAHGEGAIKIGRNKMGYDIGTELERGFFTLVGGQPRCSIIHDALTYRIKGIPLEDYSLIIEYYLQRINLDCKLANYPEIVLYEQNPAKDFLDNLFGPEKGAQYYRVYQKFFSGLKDIENNLDKIYRNDFIPRWRVLIKQQEERLGAEDILSEIDQFREVTNLLRTEACVMFVQAARVGFFVYARLRNLLKEIFGKKGEEYLNTLTSGIPLELNPNLSFSVMLFQYQRGVIPLEKVLSEFGHLGIHELEISVPRYHENPRLLIDLACKINENPQIEMEVNNQKGDVLRKKLLLGAGEFKEKLAREIDMVRRYLPLREVVKFEFLRGYNILRKLALRMEKYLGWEEGLIFYLYPEEVFILADNHIAFHEVAKSRKQKQKTEKSLYVPAVFSSQNLDLIGEPLKSDSSILSGVGVTNFTTEGEVVVITDLNDRDAILSLKPGNILVTITTDPAWTPLLSIVGSKGGLITEVGGLLAHGAIYAREVGMAAVLNIPNATQILKTGMRVRVNGPQGYVEILR